MRNVSISSPTQNTISALLKSLALEGRIEKVCGEAPPAIMMPGLPMPDMTLLTNEWMGLIDATTDGVFD